MLNIHQLLMVQNKFQILINKQNLEANKNQLKDGLKIVGDFLNKSVLIPNNINFPMSRNEFIKLI